MACPTLPRVPFLLRVVSGGGQGDKTFTSSRSIRRVGRAAGPTRLGLDCMVGLAARPTLQTNFLRRPSQMGDRELCCSSPHPYPLPAGEGERRPSRSIAGRIRPGVAGGHDAHGGDLDLRPDALLRSSAATGRRHCREGIVADAAAAELHAARGALRLVGWFGRRPVRNAVRPGDASTLPASPAQRLRRAISRLADRQSRRPTVFAPADRRP